MKKIIFSLILALFLFMPFVNAGVAASAAGAAGASAAAASAARERANTAYIMDQAQNSGCRPPEEWAKEHNCILSYDTSLREVGAYICQNKSLQYRIRSTCEGEVTVKSKWDYQINNIPFTRLEYIFGGAALIVSAIAIYGLLRRRE